MKSKHLIAGKTAFKALLAGMLAGWLGCCAGNLGLAQTPSTNASTLSPDLQEVVKLSQAHMGDDVIINFINNSGKSYKLSADDIIYLNSHGVSQGVISALQTAAAAPAPSPMPPPAQAATPPAPAAPPSPASTVTPVPMPSSPAPPVAGSLPPPAPGAGATPPPASEVNFDYFHAQLSPFGTWLQVAPYGWCWHPDQAIAVNPDWRPYYDMGQWVYTEDGWFWQSDYTWGDIPFHYGNWVLDPGLGWLWVPGYTWGPAWVFWREADADGCIGWAPLPWGAVFVDGGWLYHGVHYGVDFDFGLGANFFVFVGFDHFHDGFFRMRGREYAFHVPRARINGFYARSELRNDFRRDAHGRLVNDGIGRDRVERFTGHREEPAHFQERNPVGDRAKLERPAAGAAGHPAAGNAGNAGHNEGVSKVYRPPAKK